VIACGLILTGLHPASAAEYSRSRDDEYPRGKNSYPYVDFNQRPRQGKDTMTQKTLNHRQFVIVTCQLCLLTSCDKSNRFVAGDTVAFSGVESVYLAFDSVHHRPFQQQELDAILATGQWELPSGIEIIEDSVSAFPSEVSWTVYDMSYTVNGAYIDFKGRMKIQPGCAKGDYQLFYSIPGIQILAMLTRTTPYVINLQPVEYSRLSVYSFTVYPNKTKLFLANLGGVLLAILGIFILILIIISRS
jgi:hypothetical protein